MDLMLSSVLISPGRIPEHPRSQCSDCEDPASPLKPSEQPAVQTALSGSGGLAIETEEEATYDSRVRRRLGAPSVSAADEAVPSGASDQARSEARPVAGANGTAGREAVDDSDAVGGSELSESEAAEAAQDVAASDLTRPKSASGEPLSDDEVRQVQSLEARDKEVRAHEQAHKAVGGAYAGTIHYDYQRGPDDKRYAVGGHVSIDMSEVPGNPAATVQKMQTVRRAALAPAEPSAADRAVAADATRKEAEARRALREEQAAEAKAATEPRAEDERVAAAGEPSPTAAGEPNLTPAGEPDPTPRGADGSVDRATLGATIERAAALTSILTPTGSERPSLETRASRRGASIRRAYGAMA